ESSVLHLEETGRRAAPEVQDLSAWLDENAIFGNDFMLEDELANRKRRFPGVPLIEGHRGDSIASYRGMRLQKAAIEDLPRSGIRPDQSSHESLHFTP